MRTPYGDDAKTRSATGGAWRGRRPRPAGGSLRWAAAAVAAVGLVVVGACGPEQPGSQTDDARAGGERSQPEETPAGSKGSADASPLLNPRSEEMSATAPDTFRVRFETSEGSFVVEGYREWAPRGADRFYNLVRHGFYDGNHFFRVLDGFVAQFGISGDPEISAAWSSATIPDDSVRASNERGTVTFATSGPDSRTTQLFVNLADNGRLDTMGFAPFGRVVEGMRVVESLYGGYGEGAPRGDGPSQARIQERGNAYLRAEFPDLDSIARARIVEP